MINEFHNREFKCVNYVPSGPRYAWLGPSNHVCSTVGSASGQPYVNGDSYMESAYSYNHAHKWRNIGIIFGFMFIFMVIYLVATEVITEKKSKGEILVFRREHKALNKDKSEKDIECGSGRSIAVEKKASSGSPAMIERHTAIFQ